jgi:uncharacterized protein YlxW (UPF0749 family)
MKKTFAIIGFILLLAFVVGGRLYKKYNRQQIKEEQLKKEKEWVIKAQKAYQIKERKRLDSIRRSKPTRLDSVRAEIEEKRKKMEELMKKLAKEKKE